MSFEDGAEFFINLQIIIADNGCGISPEGQKKLFVDFGKLEENSKSNPTGTGLGLSISKQIIEQMGGSVTVESKLKEGTKFIINFKTKCKSKDVEINKNV